MGFVAAGTDFRLPDEAQVSSSPRMPHTLVEIFTNAQLPDFKNRNSWAGRGQHAR